MNRFLSLCQVRVSRDVFEDLCIGSDVLLEVTLFEIRNLLLTGEDVIKTEVGLDDLNLKMRWEVQRQLITEAEALVLVEISLQSVITLNVADHLLDLGPACHDARWHFPVRTAGAEGLRSV